MCTIKKEADFNDTDFSSMDTSSFEDPLVVTKRILKRYNLKKHGFKINEQEYYEIIDELKKLNLLLQDIHLILADLPRQVSLAITGNQKSYDHVKSLPKESKISQSPPDSQISDDLEILDLITENNVNNNFEKLDLDGEKTQSSTTENDPTDPYNKSDLYLHWKRNFEKNSSKVMDTDNNCWLKINEKNTRNEKPLTSYISELDHKIWLK